MVPQEGYLFSATLRENLSYGAPDAVEALLNQVVQQAQLQTDLDSFPEGYQTIVGERGITLSGGQRQRTSLARALLVDAPLLVLDDALASVDNRTAAAILQSLTIDLHRTVLFISHQLSAAAACDRVLVIVEGRLVQEGTHRELLAQEGTYRKLWEREKASSELEAAAG
jgi:ATP-binding cassette subfamily B protein